MARADDIFPITNNAALWHAFDPTVKADLYSTAIQTSAGLFIVDPIPLTPSKFSQIKATPKIAGVCITNSNHFRASVEFATALSTSIYLHRCLCPEIDFPALIPLDDAQSFAESSCSAVTLDGGPLGEIALHCHDNRGTMIFGDALINFEPHGFGVLPAKYCVNPKQLRQSLRKVLDHSFERMFFAHGSPILANARSRVERLLDNE